MSFQSIHDCICSIYIQVDISRSSCNETLNTFLNILLFEFPLSSRPSERRTSWKLVQRHVCYKGIALFLLNNVKHFLQPISISVGPHHLHDLCLKNWKPLTARFVGSKFPLVGRRVYIILWLQIDFTLMYQSTSDTYNSDVNSKKDEIKFLKFLVFSGF